MRGFTMCPECRREYNDPSDRRFHAQPNACPICGPQLQLVDASANPVQGDPLSLSIDYLKQGRIIAIKGLGGFLLACDATNDSTVALLRERKRRRCKPFAIMVSDVDEAEACCRVSPLERDLLLSPQAPIVLLRARQSSVLSPHVAPNTIYMGVMLPYTPLHHLLIKRIGRPLVMTSGNLSEEPIARDNDEALQRLSGIADYFLIHNRDICSRYDDSVTMVADNRVQMIRRARSFAPHPIRLKHRSARILACGAEMKSTFCMTRDNYAFLSQHIGDLENLETLGHFEDTIGLYKRIFHIEPEIIAYDMHPDYLSTRYAMDLVGATGLKGVPVQHHHAHIASCMADNGVDGPVLGVALDGTGYGEDGAVWGGEFLLADYSDYRRVAHFEYMPLPGGDAAILKPYRMALSYLFKVFGSDFLNMDLPFLRRIDRDEIAVIGKQIKAKLNVLQTSSCGRLFDAVSALLDVCGESDYEGQAAIELESIAEKIKDEKYSYNVFDKGGIRVISFDGMIRGIVDDIRDEAGNSFISGKFHATIADVILNACRQPAKENNINKAALSGGVFQNRLLLELVVERLEAEDMTVLLHRDVPANDGGIALGQAVIAQAKMNKAHDSMHNEI